MTRAALVTGATGFIGRALVGVLLDRGWDVVGASRTPSTRTSDVPLVDYSALGQHRQRVCFHLASSAEGTADDEQRNDALALLHELLRMRFPRVISASSAAVYGDRTARPHREDGATNPRTAYARLKLSCETPVLEAGHTVARITNTYGAGMSPRNVLSDLLRQLPGPVIRVHDASAVRDFVHVEDVAAALADLGSSASEDDAAGVFNVGTGVGTRVDDLAQGLARHTGAGTLEVRSEAPAEESGSTLVIDPSRLHARLCWRARLPLGRGLERLVQERAT